MEAVNNKLRTKYSKQKEKIVQLQATSDGETWVKQNYGKILNAIRSSENLGRVLETIKVDDIVVPQGIGNTDRIRFKNTGVDRSKVYWDMPTCPLCGQDFASVNTCQRHGQNVHKLTLLEDDNGKKYSEK